MEGRPGNSSRAEGEAASATRPADGSAGTLRLRCRRNIQMQGSAAPT